MGKDFWSFVTLGPAAPLIKKAIGGDGDGNKPPAPPPTPAPPKPGDSLDKAKQDAENRRRASLLAGGDTNVTKGGGNLVGGQVAVKNLLGQ